MPLHAFTHVQLALSERNREPVLTFFLQRFPTYSASTLQLRCFHNQRFLLPTSCFLFLPPSSPPSSNSNPPASRRPPASKDYYSSSSPSSCICSKQQPSYVPLSVEDAARVPPCSAPLVLIPSPPFRFESGLRAAHVYCPILGTSPATGELFPA